MHSRADEKKQVDPPFPDASSMAALRSWCEGLAAREAARRYLNREPKDGQSSRAMLGRIRRQLVKFVRARQHNELARSLESLGPHADNARGLLSAAESLRSTPVAHPLITDKVEHWLPKRSASALKACGIKSLADLVVRVPRRRQWWRSVPGLGAAGAASIETFFAQHSELIDRARALSRDKGQPFQDSLERSFESQELDGSRGTFRAPRATCALRASNDLEAVSAWLNLHESQATQRAYRKEAERLLLWAAMERGCALSSLNTEDATAFRAFLRRPSPRARWVGPSRPRTDPEWKPFSGDLSARSVAYSLSVLNALFRWLIEQRYVLANPFSGMRTRGGGRAAPLDSRRGFSDGEWALVRTVAEGMEWRSGWTLEAAQRLRFILDFCYATGLRSGELVDCSLGNIRRDATGNAWLDVVGKGAKSGHVFLPPQALGALDTYLAQRGLTTLPSRWNPATPLLSSVMVDGPSISSGRLWQIVKRFFLTVATNVEKDSPALAQKLKSASPHWMRHTHASHSLANGAELTTVRDNLRHASISTTSVYLHGDDAKRARQLREAFR